MNAMHDAVPRADPRLSRFDPLQRIMFFDDFDEGLNGWTTLVGNYEGSLDTMHPGFRQHMPPMLSQVTHWDAGTHGSFDGTYAMKIATRAKAGYQNTAIKRITYRKAARIQLETYFTFKPEANELVLSDLDVRSVGVLFDLQDGEHRVMPHLRYVNALDGERMHKWQYKERTPGFNPLGSRGETVTHYHLSPQDWLDLPGGAQKLCYNEIPTKINWHYLKVGFDLATMRYTGFQCNDREFDMSGVGSIVTPAMKNLWCMLNVVFFVEAETDKRSFFYLDSVLLSGEF